MAAKSDLIFNVRAQEDASRAFLKIAAAVEALEKKLDELDGKKVKVTVEVDVKDDKLNKIKGDLDKLKDRDVKVRVDIDDAGLRRLGDRASTSRGKVKVDVDVDTGGAERKLDEVDRKLDGLDGETAQVEVDADTGAAAAKLAAIEKQADSLDGKEVNIDVDVDQDNLTGVSRGFDQAGRSADTAGDRIVRFSGRAGDGLGTVSRRTTDLAGAFISVGGAALKWTAIAVGVSTAGAGITAVYGAAATAVAALPGAVAMIAAPIATVAVGFEGIKKAAQALRPEFEALQQTVSATFEKGLVPAFENLRAVFPTIRDGMVGIADALSEGAVQMTGFLSSTEGIAGLQGVFEGVSGAIREMTPGIIQSTDALLTLASQPEMFDALTEAVNRFGTAFNESVTKLVGDGTIQRAFEGLGDVLGEVGEGFVSLVENGIELFAGAAPGVAKGLDGITEFFNKFDWEYLGRSVGGVFEGIGEALRNVPQTTIDAIEGAFASLAEVFQSPEFAQGLQGFIGSLPAAIELMGGLVQGLAYVGQGLEALTAPGAPFGPGGIFGPNAPGRKEALQDFLDIGNAVTGAGEAIANFGLGLELAAGKASAWTKLKTDFVDFAAAAAENLISDFGGFAGITADVPVQVNPVIQAATGSIAQGVGALQQAIRGLMAGGITVETPVEVKAAIEIAMGGIAQGVGALQQAVRGLIGQAGSVEAKVQVKPVIEMALEGIAQGVGALQQAVRGLIGGGMAVEVPVRVSPMIEMALDGISQGVGALQQAIRGLIGGGLSVEVPLDLLPKPNWQSLPNLPTPNFGSLSPPSVDVPITLNPVPQWGQAPSLPAPPTPPSPPAQDVFVTYNPRVQLGPMPAIPSPPAPPPAFVDRMITIRQQPQVQTMPIPAAPSVPPVATTQLVNVTQQANVTPPPTPPAPRIPPVYTTQTVYVRQVTVVTASGGAIAGATAGASAGVGASVAPRQAAGGGVVGFAGGGPVRSFPAGGVLSGYAPGKDTIPAMLSKGEAVLVPELVRQLGPGNIMAANYAASRRKAAVLPMHAGGTVGLPMPRPWRRRSDSPELGAWLSRLERHFMALHESLVERARQIAITVNDQSGNPVETARAMQLALRMAAV